MNRGIGEKRKSKLQGGNAAKRQAAPQHAKRNSPVLHIAYLACVVVGLALGHSCGRMSVERAATRQVEQKSIELEAEYKQKAAHLRNKYTKDAKRLKREADIALWKAEVFHTKAAALSSQALAQTYKSEGLMKFEDFLANGNGRAVREAEIVGAGALKVVLGNADKNVRPNVAVTLYDQNGFPIGSFHEIWIFDEIYAGGRYPKEITTSGILGISHVRYVKVEDTSKLW